MEKKITVKTNEEEPESVEIIADAIIKISDAPLVSKAQAKRYNEADVKNLAEKNMRELTRYGGMIKIETKSDMIPADSQRVEKPDQT